MFLTKLQLALIAAVVLVRGAAAIAAEPNQPVLLLDDDFRTYRARRPADGIRGTGKPMFLLKFGKPHS